MTNAKSAAPAFARPLAVTEFDLAAPLTDAEGATVARIRMTEPTARQLIQAERMAEKAGTEAAQFQALVGLCSDLPKGLAPRLKIRDVGRLMKWLADLSREALEVDGLLDVASVADGDPFGIEPTAIDEGAMLALAGEREFELIAPFEHEGRRIDRLVAREPEIDAIMTAGKLKLSSERTVAMLAATCGETMPAMSWLAQRDLARLEAWLAPFASGLISPGAGI